ncbi:lipopolysaccharide biosynthesis protein [Pseudarthrobacter phenanthrenivorans]|uniref:Lipopolysaccharide biosynthesis protein n=1 Tax=Pseudarthrobacter phenanthrenivorans TaxID=361575 RepID=A0A3B0FRW7_PSEPS|nr:lipopolysaccharide biosynthesis protein [Pseudarthrobacter phenanthrenivorans]RKO22595.1 lipopolysaccharide biosynthesis protein [Pseudarthrobacter phenanthrenivorans]
MDAHREDLATQVRHGLAWSSINTLVLKLGTFAMGIVLARLLAPEQFGVFAVALTVQLVLMSLADLGMTADLVRSPDPARLAPTIATLGLATGAMLTTTLALSAQGLADVLGSPGAGPVIAVMAASLLLAGAGVVPYAALQRRFAQKKLFIISIADFVVGSGLTVLLVLSGLGVMALALGRLAAQLVTLVLQFILSGERVRPGFDRKIAPEVLAFGLPVAAANVLSWALLNVDNVVISRVAGPVALGFYFLAFNVSNWPMSALGQVVRSISIPAFSRVADGRSDKSLSAMLGPLWAVSLLAGLMLAVLSSPLIELVYGSRWLPAAAILAWLGIFGALRTLFDLAASYLLARGAAKATLVVQILWITGLLPAAVLGMLFSGTTAVAAAHLAAAILVVCPAYAVALHRAGADVTSLVAKIWPPLAAAVPAAGVSLGVMTLTPTPLTALLAGGASGGCIYILLLFRWFRQHVRIAGAMLPRGETPINPHHAADQSLAAPSGGMS